MIRTAFDIGAAERTAPAGRGGRTPLRRALRLIEAIRLRRRRRAVLATLSALDDLMLRDIGLSREEIFAARAYGRPPARFHD